MVLLHPQLEFLPHNPDLSKCLSIHSWVDCLLAEASTYINEGAFHTSKAHQKNT